MKKNRPFPAAFPEVPVSVAVDTYLDAYAAIRKLQRLARDRPHRAVSQEAARRVAMLRDDLGMAVDGHSAILQPDWSMGMGI